jgi:GT2 family glycosyltransferase
MQRALLTDVALTICIPTYQRPVFVQRALQSAMAASCAWADRVELIVSDNSPELTSGLCQAALAQWPGRALYLGNVPNIGMIANLNQCIARATGRYLLFLHDDDYLLTGGTESILAATRSAKDRDAALLFGVQVVDGDGRLRRHQFFKQKQYLSPPEAVVRLLSDPSFVRAPALVVRRDVFDAVGTFDQTVGSPTDFDMWLRVFSRFGVRCLPATISAYSVHEAAETTRTFTAETVRTALQIFDRAAAMGILPPRIVRQCEADSFHQFILAGAGRQVAVGDRRGASAIMALFRLPEIRALGLSRRWLAIRVGMHLLVTMPGKVSRAVARGTLSRMLVDAALADWPSDGRRYQYTKSVVCDTGQCRKATISLAPKDL